MIRALSSAIALAALLPAGPLISQSADIRFTGQAFGSAAYGNDPLPLYSNVEGTANYIPALNYSTNLGGKFRVDILTSYQFGYRAARQSSPAKIVIDDSNGFYRNWIQLRSDKWEARLGRQKLAFGPAQFLRPLAWFDTIDLRDPTGQTIGVDAVRFRLFPSDRLTVWTWGILPYHKLGYDLQEFSPGGRAEFVLGNYEIGATVYHRGDIRLGGIGIFPAIITGPETRAALDIRADLFIGLWSEALISRGAKISDGYDSAAMLMIGADYTLPIGNGLLLMGEHQVAKATGGAEVEDMSSQASALMVSLPLGFLDTFSAVAFIDYSRDINSIFFMWQRTYDNFSLSTLVLANPTRLELGSGADQFSSVVGVGSSVQLLLIYYH